MAKFSSRNGYDPKSSGPPKFEEAPEWLRTSYLNGIFEKISYVDEDLRYSNTENRPLGIKDIGEKFYALIRQDPDQDIYDSFYCLDTLKSAVKSAEWFHFYDFIELIAQNIKACEIKAQSKNSNNMFGIKNHCTAVNTLFKDNNIGWRINEKCELVRETPQLISELNKKLENEFKNEFDSAREHYRKAYRYTYERPLDPENSIKEIVSAIESAGKVFYKDATTLGDVIKEMRKDQKFPSSMINVLEKFYVMSNIEPGVRHGSANRSRISIHDAELSLHIGVAFIRYLIAKYGK